MKRLHGNQNKLRFNKFQTKSRMEQTTFASKNKSKFMKIFRCIWITVAYQTLSRLGSFTL